MARRREHRGFHKHVRRPVGTTIATKKPPDQLTSDVRENHG
jgi:hypothetical protein